MTDRMGKNYNTDGGNRTVIGGILEFAGDAEVKGFPGAANLKPKDTNTAADIREDLNALITNLKNAGVMIPDAWNLSALACPTPASMPTEATAANSGHATVSVEDNVVTITLDCKVSALAEADHGEVWSTHRYLLKQIMVKCGRPIAGLGLGFGRVLDLLKESNSPTIQVQK